MVSSSRFKRAVEQGEALLSSGGLGLPDDPAAEEAAELGNRVIAEAIAGGATEESAYQKGLNVAIEHYLDHPLEGAYEAAEPLP